MPRKGDTAPSVLAVIFVFILIYYFGFDHNSTLETNMNEKQNVDTDKVVDKKVSKDYGETFDFVVKDDVCEIPRINPFTPELAKVSQPQFTCAVHPHFTRPLVSSYLINTTGRYILQINEKWKDYYVEPKEEITCCFREIEIANGSAGADFKTNVLPCFLFQQDFVVPRDVNGIIVNCMRRGNKKVIFMDAFFFIQQKKRNLKKIGVLLLGIDSISQINFRRRMPETYRYLRNHKNDWYEMLGYNKLGYDAFPNLMALLTGYNHTTKHPDCIPHHHQQSGALDTCPFLWNYAKELGMSTAFGADRTDIRTLTTDTVGFMRPPTDYYLRPYMLATEQRLRLSGAFKLRKYCLGARFSANYVLGYALDFALQHIGNGGLGLFWINSFRDSYEEPSMIQRDLTNYLNLLKMMELLDSYVVILLSGNGMLHGPLGAQQNEFYEERLPILYISIPNAWKREHPDFVEALKRNHKRLVSPLDLHETVKHMLELGAGAQLKVETAKTNLDCPRCQSLLKPLAENRSCGDAGIGWMWCSCEPFQAQLYNSNLTSVMMQSLLTQMNKYLQIAGLFNGTCYTLSLHKIYGVYKSQRTTDYYYVKFMTSMRSAEFEIGFWYDSNKTLAVYIDTEKVNRLYDEAMNCLLQDEQDLLKKFCVCVENVVNTDTHIALTDGVTAVTAKN